MSSAMDKNEIKKTKGRQRIEIKKIEKKSRLQVAFTKRRNGLFKKARELNVLSGAQLAIIAMSPGNKAFAFGEGSSVDSVIDRFIKEELNMGTNTVLIGEGSKMNYQYGSETVRKIEREKNINMECEQGNAKFYCDKPIDNMQLDELEEYSKSLQELKNNLLNRVNELGNLPSSPSPSNMFALSKQDSPSNLFALSNHDSKFKFDGSLSQSHILELDDFNEDHSSVLEEIRAALMDEELTHTVKDFDDGKSFQKLNNNLLNPVSELGNLPLSSSPPSLFALSNQDSKFNFDDSLSLSHILDLDDFNEDHSSVLEEIRAALMVEELTYTVKDFDDSVLHRYLPDFL